MSKKLGTFHHLGVKYYECGCTTDNRMNITCKRCIVTRISEQSDYGKTPAIICMGIVAIFMGVAIFFALS